jgi:hypothetical protein
MAILGLLLMAAAAVIGTEIVVSNTQFTNAEAFNRVVEGVTAGGFFLAGVIAGAVFLLGLALLLGGVGRGRRRRVSRREAVSEVSTTADTLAAENDSLRRELAEERLNRATLGGVAVPAGTPDSAGPYADQITDTYHKELVTEGAYAPTLAGGDPYPDDAGRTEDATAYGRGPFGAPLGGKHERH